MKKIGLFFSVICMATLLSVSCRGNQNTSTSRKQIDTAWNEKAQDTFYGVTFGEPISKVITQLSDNGFYLQKDISTADLLHFAPRQSQFFSFGGSDWEMLDVSATDSIFTGIRFMSAYNDKASALNAFNSLKRTVGSKYKLSELSSTDTTLYAGNAIYARNNVYAYISCFRYETISNELRIGVLLAYLSTKKYGKALDEL